MTPDDIISKWIGAGILHDDPIIKRAIREIVAGLKADIQQTITVAVEEENRACAEIANEFLKSGDRHAAQLIGDRIRERCNKSATENNNT